MSLFPKENWHCSGNWKVRCFGPFDIDASSSVDLETLWVGRCYNNGILTQVQPFFIPLWSFGKVNWYPSAGMPTSRYHEEVSSSELKHVHDLKDEMEKYASGRLSCNWVVISALCKEKNKSFNYLDGAFHGMCILVWKFLNSGFVACCSYFH